MTLFERILSSASDLFAFAASGIAIFLYFFKRDKIVNAINVLLNYSTQLTLTDLKSKIERLNDYNANEPTHIEHVTNILNEIDGQINGNAFLRMELKTQHQKLISFTSNTTKITEPLKRSFVAELRESLRTVDVSHYHKSFANNKKE
jgi:hypothetical protein